MMRTQSVIARLLIVAVAGLCLNFPVNAAMVSTAELAAAGSGASAERARIQAWLAREDVVRRLQHYGVKPADAQERVAVLTDDEARTLAGELDSLPAGGDVIGALVLIFVILLVTDILGYTKVFPFTRSVR